MRYINAYQTFYGYIFMDKLDAYTNYDIMYYLFNTKVTPKLYRVKWALDTETFNDSTFRGMKYAIYN